MASRNGTTLGLSSSSVYSVILGFWSLQMIVDAVLLGLFTFWAKFPGSKVLPRWLVIVTLIAKVLAGIIHVIEFSLDLRGGETVRQVVIENIFWTLFYYASRCSTFYVFYEFIQLLMERFNDLKRYVARTRIIHWAVLASILITAIVSWGLLVDVEIRTGTMDYQGHLSSNAGQTVHGVICWFAGTEIMSWSIFLTVKAFRHQLSFKWKLFSCLFLCTSVAFAGFTFFTVLYDFLYISPGASYRSNSSTLLGTAIVTVLEVIFDIITWIALLFCWARWAKLVEGQRRAIERGPRNASPTELGDSSSAHWLVEADAGNVPEVDGTSKHYHEADGRTKGILESNGQQNMVFELDSRPRSHY